MGLTLSCFFDGIEFYSVEKREADILKLDIDCFEELFEYLSLADLVSVGQTCKRLQQVARYFFQQNYSMFRGNEISENKIVTFRSKECIEIDCFAAFIGNIVIRPEGLQYFLNIQSKFHRLKKIELYQMKNADMEMIIDRMVPTLSKLKELHIGWCDLDKFHDVISLCPNITSLSISNCWIALDWIHGKYPTLEYLKIVASPIDSSVHKLPMFLEQNPNIRKLAINIDFFWVNQDALKKADIKLDELAISIWCNHFILVQSLLNEFHALGFFKRLHLYVDDMGKTWNQELATRLNTVNGLVELEIEYLSDNITLSELIDLEELGGFRIYAVSDLEKMAIKLVNLKRISWIEAQIDHLLPFIRHSVKMQKIRIGFITDETGERKETYVIDLVALNREREKLPEAHKITLYVKEKIFLATKWALGDTDLRLIRMKRDDSFDWGDYFEFL